MNDSQRRAQLLAELDEISEQYDQVYEEYQNADEDDENAGEAYATNEFLLRDRMTRIERELRDIDAGR